MAYVYTVRSEETRAFSTARKAVEFLIEQYSDGSIESKPIGHYNTEYLIHMLNKQGFILLDTSYHNLVEVDKLLVE